MKTISTQTFGAAQIRKHKFGKIDNAPHLLEKKQIECVVILHCLVSQMILSANRIVPKMLNHVL
jgi:hypothetical protein